MAEGTRSQELNRKWEETMRNVLNEHREALEKEMDALRSFVMESQQANTPHMVLPHSESGMGFHGSSSYQASTRLSRLEFPRFNGDNFRGWLLRCEQFFEVDNTPSETKVKLAVMHMEGRALQWHQVFSKSRFTSDVPSWEDYVRNLASQFWIRSMTTP